MADDKKAESPPSVKTSIDGVVRHIARPIRGCATDDQYTDVVERATEALTAAAETLERASWQPIETAPKTPTTRNFGGTDAGPRFLAWPLGGLVGATHYWKRPSGESGFVTDWGTHCEPTHWQPLPDPPKVSKP